MDKEQSQQRENTTGRQSKLSLPPAPLKKSRNRSVLSATPQEQQSMRTPTTLTTHGQKEMEQSHVLSADGNIHTDG